MPIQAITHIISDLIGLAAIHQKEIFFLRQGIRMGVISMFPLRIWIKQIREDGTIWEEQWVFMPHLLLTKPAARTKDIMN